jgi:hypothetical protein
MVKNIQIFMLGYLVNAMIWRLDAGQMTDIKCPAILSVLCILIIGIQYLKERKAH